MIDNNRLRPGNIVCVGKNDDGSDRIGKIGKVEANSYSDWTNSWDEPNCVIEIDSKFWVFDEIYPVKLTEEWLEKLGFIENDGKWYLNNDNTLFFCGLTLVDTPSKTDLWIFFGENMEGIIDASVHSLQNLYWGFTGKELLL
jgi:hypothetical protein